MKRKLVIYFTGILALAIGSNLFLNAALGVAPVCSLALTFTFLLPGSYAFYNFIVNSFCVILECILLKRFTKAEAVQLGITFIYAYAIKFTGLFLTGIQPSSLLEQILLACFACFVMALGVNLTVQSHVTVMPYEGFMKALSEKTKMTFGTLRVIVDVVCTLTSILLSLCLLHNIQSVGLGTIIASFLTGVIVNLDAKLLNKRIERFIFKPRQSLTVQ